MLGSLLSKKMTDATQPLFKMAEGVTKLPIKTDCASCGPQSIAPRVANSRKCQLANQHGNNTLTFSPFGLPFRLYDLSPGFHCLQYWRQRTAQ